MTDQNKRHVEIVLDRSGSMAAIKSDAEGGLREFIKTLSEIDTPTTVTLQQFDTHFETVFADKALAEVPEWRLVPRGGTALRDAVGRTIDSLGARLANMAEDDRPGQVVIVIQTDGHENSSIEYSDAQIKKMITEQQEQWKWQFVFLGADQDAFDAANTYGIPTASAASYDSTNTVGTYAMAAAAVNRSTQTGLEVSFTDEEREEAVKPKTKLNPKRLP